LIILIGKYQSVYVKFHLTPFLRRRTTITLLHSSYFADFEGFSLQTRGPRRVNEYLEKCGEFSSIPKYSLGIEVLKNHGEHPNYRG
jgi:hypothetical protein